VGSIDSPASEDSEDSDSEYVPGADDEDDEDDGLIEDEEEARSMRTLVSRNQRISLRRDIVIEKLTT
jgi:hypothetical protein